MPTDEEIAKELQRQTEEEGTTFSPQPFAVAWKLRDGTPLARILPDLTTLHGAREFLEQEKGVDTGEEPWAIVYRRGDDIIATGYEELKAKAIEVFVEKEDMVPC